MSEPRAQSPAWRGEFSDGRSAGVRSVRVHFDGAGFVVCDASDGEAIARWMLADVAVDAIQERDVIHLQSRVDPDALITLYGADARAGLRELGMRSSALPRARSQRLAMIALCSAAIAGVATLIWNGVPIVSRAIARQVPLDAERSLGIQLEHELSDQYCESEAASLVLAVLASRLAGDAHSIRSIDVLNVDMPNAFAFPGGNLILTRGLIEDAQSSDEVAGVLAHEIAHVLERHVMTRIVRGALLSALWAASVGDFSGLMAIDPTTAFEIATLQFSREEELEADRGAVEMLARAGIRPDAFAGFFERLSEEEAGLPEWLSTHPASAGRAEIAAASGAALSAGVASQPALSDEAWATLRAVCRDAPEPAAGFYELVFD
ncbi:MAG TPA: M48 family metallopeptidase [Myxococcota bacterium]|nr:M48 family metallopeptidase [Myxococcota bacterium]